MGYGLPAGGTQAGKFKYTREGVNPPEADTYPMNMAGCAITSLNSPSNSEIHLSPQPEADEPLAQSPHEASLTSYLTPACQNAALRRAGTPDEGVMQYGESVLCGRTLNILPADSVGIVPCAVLQHPATDLSM